MLICVHSAHACGGDDDMPTKQRVLQRWKTRPKPFSLNDGAAARAAGARTRVASTAL